MIGRAKFVGEIGGEEGEREVAEIDQPQQAPAQAEAERQQTVHAPGQDTGDQRLAEQRGAWHRYAGLLFLPSEAGEVAPSYGDGGVKVIVSHAHDPSARYAGTSPRKRGEEKKIAACGSANGTY